MLKTADQGSQSLKQNDCITQTIEIKPPMPSETTTPP